MHVKKFINKLGNKDPAIIRSSIYERGILSTYDPTGTRMVFYTSKNQRFNESDDLNLECNGLVMDIKNMKSLVIPPLTYRSNIVPSVVNGFLENNLYDVSYVNDGTTFNLYWWDDSWCISTTRSYDLTDKKWGNLSYRQLIKNTLGDREEKFYNSLDVNKSYTFGLRHSDLHPFKEGLNTYDNKIWFIQSVSLDDQNIISYDCDNFIEFGIKKQETIKYPINNVKTLFKQLNDALNNYLYKKSDPLYGFILRSRDIDKTGSHSNILLESTLLKKIRQLYYHSSFNIISQDRGYDRNTFILIHAYLDINRCMYFKQLFPQFNHLIDNLNNITTALVNNIIEYSINKDKINLINESDQMKLYVKILYTSFISLYPINRNNNNIYKLITSYLLTDRHIDIYYNLFILNK